MWSKYFEHERPSSVTLWFIKSISLNPSIIPSIAWQSDTTIPVTLLTWNSSWWKFIGIPDARLFFITSNQSLSRPWSNFSVKLGWVIVKAELTSTLICLCVCDWKSVSHWLLRFPVAFEIWRTPPQWKFQPRPKNVNNTTSKELKPPLTCKGSIILAFNHMDAYARMMSCMSCDHSMCSLCIHTVFMFACAQRALGMAAGVIPAWTTGAIELGASCAKSDIFSKDFQCLSARDDFFLQVDILFNPFSIRNLWGA